MDPSRLELNDRLIVAADFKCEPGEGASVLEAKLLKLVDKLAGTGAIFKFNSALRALGLYRVAELMQERGVRFFADLKLVDIPATLKADGSFLRETKPAIVTVMANADVAGMRALREAMSPESFLLAVTVLTSLDDARCQEVYGCSAVEGVMRFAPLALEAGANGLILSPKEVAVVRGNQRFNEQLLVTPGIRFEDSPPDDQKRTMTPREAINAGAQMLVVGRPIVGATDPRVAYLRFIEQIEQGIIDTNIRGC